MVMLKVKYYKYFFVLLLIVSSFYFTDKLMIYIDNKKPLMQSIKSKANDYESVFVNSVIENNTIIPGIKGRVVNYKKSLLQMEDFGAFNDKFLVYDYIAPDVSIENNKDKIIIKGNSKKRSISLILEPNASLEKYLEDNRINYDLLSTIDSDFSLKREYLNGYKSLDSFKDLESILNRGKFNTKICLMGYSNYEYCLKKEHYLVKSSLDTNILINDLLNKISSGDIILIYDSFSLENLKLVLSEIKRQDLSIVYLSELIDEKN